MTQDEFATLVGIKQPYVSRLARGIVVPGSKVSRRIVLATGGEITLAELMFWEPVTQATAGLG